MSETIPEDHLIILRELLAGNKTLTTSNSIQARANGSRVQVNYSHTSVKLYLSCTIGAKQKYWIFGTAKLLYGLI